MTLARPYYRLHQIISDQYAVLGELVNKSGEDYEGPYHVLPNGNLFSEYRPSQKSIQLFYKRVDVAPLAKEYNLIRGGDQLVSNYTSPKYYTPTPTFQDYLDGYFVRYFSQKRNSPLSTIMEISYEDYTRANLSNAPGISLQLYRVTSLKWTISRASYSDAVGLNRSAVFQAEMDFPGLGIFLSHLGEFYQSTKLSN